VERGLPELAELTPLPICGRCSFVYLCNGMNSANGGDGDFRRIGGFRSRLYGSIVDVWSIVGTPTAIVSALAAVSSLLTAIIAFRQARLLLPTGRLRLCRVRYQFSFNGIVGNDPICYRSTVALAVLIWSAIHLSHASAMIYVFVVIYLSCLASVGSLQSFDLALRRG
jgi:hypothetical protein